MDESCRCPFCGAKVERWDVEGFGVVQVVECKGCNVRFVFPWGDDIVEHFNRRAGKSYTDE